MGFEAIWINRKKVVNREMSNEGTANVKWGGIQRSPKRPPKRG